MDRVRTTLSGAIPPVYKDPGGPSTPPAGTFQTNPALPATSLTPEHANLITEELRNLVIALGGTPASDDDTQLATLVGGRINNSRIRDIPVGAATESGSALSFDSDGTLVMSRASSGSEECVIPIPLQEGESIVSYSARILDESDTSVTTEIVTTIDNIRQGDAQGAPSNTPQTSDLSGTWQTLSHTLATPYSYPPGDVETRQMYLLVTLTTSNTGSIKVGKVRIQTSMS